MSAAEVWHLRERLERHERLVALARSRTFRPNQGLPEAVRWDDPSRVIGWLDLGYGMPPCVAVYGHDGIWFVHCSEGRFVAALARWELVRQMAPDEA